MAHVFIVNEKTLNVHLKYLFAGTGAKDYKCTFLTNNNEKIHFSKERLLVSMIADISRIRKGDSVLFYLQQTVKHEGMFFGSFVVEEPPFLCNDNYLENDLEKNLIFRVLLKPQEVYPKGITERECLDSLKNIDHPYEMCWSLIYRKLKGNRGCTMITDFEYSHILEKIRSKSSDKCLKCNNLSFDNEKAEIIENKIEKNTMVKKNHSIY